MLDSDVQKCTCVALDRQQVTGDASHGLQRRVCDVIRGEDDVTRVCGAAPGDNGQRAGFLTHLPVLHRPVSYVYIKLHIR